MKKKLAWVLAMCMVLQLSSFTVFAEEGQGGSEPAGVEIVTDNDEGITAPGGQAGELAGTGEEGIAQPEGEETALDETEN